MSDWIKVHRRLLDSDVFANPDTLKIWVWLLLRAHYKDKIVSLKTGRGYEDVMVKRGKVLFGRNKAAEKLEISASAIVRHLKKLEDLGKIKIKANNHYSIITICKYDIYQYEPEITEQPTIQPIVQPTIPPTIPPTVGATDTNKKDKKDKKENNVFNTMPIFSDFNGIPEHYISKSIESIKITKRVDITRDDVTGLWEIFKVQNLTGKNYYANEGKIYSHFIDKLKFQKFDNGKQLKSGTSNIGKSLEFDQP